MLRPLLLLILACAFTMVAQDRVPEQYLHERILAIVPMIGAGTSEDPIRPMFMPKPGEESKSPFLSVQYEISDDGKSALVEFVAPDKEAFKEILAARGRDAQVFERGKSSTEEVEREFSKVKQNYKFRQPGKEEK